MHTQHDEHAHRNLEHVEEPLDAANQALSDALHISFRILKAIMVVLVVLYLFTNVKCIESHEEALRLRLGELLPGVHDAGMVKAWPYPLEEILVIPTGQANTLTIDSHNFHRLDHEIKKELDFISRSPSRGLDPVLDGALMTSDQGLVHVQWSITYKFEDAASYVSNIEGGDKIDAAEELIKIMVETVGIAVASEMTAEEVIRTRAPETQERMRFRVNERLRAIDSGIVVESVDMNLPTPPIQVRDAFNNTQKAENAKLTTIRRAQQEKEQLLNDAAGSSYREFESLFEQLDQAAGDEQKEARIHDRIDYLLEHEAEGRAGTMIKAAGAYQAAVVGRMKSDVELYRALIAEYERNPALLVARLWEETRQSILNDRNVVKLYRPWGVGQFRLQITRDPEQRRIDEAIRLMKEESDISKILSQDIPVPVGIYED